MKERYIEIGDRLRIRRKEMGLTQEKAAELLDISVGYYQQLEWGKAEYKAARVIQLYEKMGLDPTYLLTGKSRGGDSGGYDKGDAGSVPQ